MAQVLIFIYESILETELFQEDLWGYSQQTVYIVVQNLAP
jgi:hypothetical protein